VQTITSRGSGVAIQASLSRRSPTSHSVSLDAARGLAAVLVLISHVRGIFLVDYEMVAHGSGLLAGVYLLTSLGHRAVVVFFVLSGYLIGSAVLRSVINNEWKWAAYLLSRSTRLWVVLLPALVLAAGWDALGQQLSAAFYHHAGAGESVLTFDISQRDSLTTFLGNVVFVQEILVKSFGSDSALWSLSYEFWYYLAFPLLLLSAVGRASLRRRIVYALLGVAILVFAGFTIAEYFLVWLLGAGLAFIVIRRPVLTTHPLAMPVLVVAAAVMLVVSFTPHLRTSSFGGDVLWAIATFALIAATRCTPGSRPMPRLYQVASIALAGCSYTLYLVHVPVLTFLRAITTPAARLQPSALSLLACGGITLAILVYAYLLALITEKQTARVRRWLAGALPSRLGLGKPTRQASVPG
jgi:peptidoglycan/LPS O-acetylase OafA/YrhL